MSERSWSITTLLRQHRRIAIDSNLLIYALDDDPLRADAAALVLDEVALGTVQGVLASIGIAEVLVGPARADDGARFEQAAATIRDLGFDILDLDADTAEEAAWIRGHTGLSMADAIHVASAREAGATALITNDRRIPARAGLEILYLDDMVA